MMLSYLYVVTDLLDLRITQNGWMPDSRITANRTNTQIHTYIMRGNWQSFPPKDMLLFAQNKKIKIRNFYFRRKLAYLRAEKMLCLYIIILLPIFLGSTYIYGSHKYVARINAAIGALERNYEIPDKVPCLLD